MSRSRKHSPCLCWCGRTNKLSKRRANRLFRRIASIAVRQGKIPPSRLREVFNVWSFNRDGLAVWVRNIDIKYMRK